MREIYGDEVRFKLVMPSTSWFRRRRGVFAEGGFGSACRRQLGRRSHLGDRGPRALVAFWILEMPQVLFLFAAGAGLMLADGAGICGSGRRIAAELRAAKEAMDREAHPSSRWSATPDRHLPAETVALSAPH